MNSASSSGATAPQRASHDRKRCGRGLAGHRPSVPSDADGTGQDARRRTARDRPPGGRTSAPMIARVILPPWLLAVGLVLGLLVLLPARRLQLAGLSGRAIGVYAVALWLAGLADGGQAGRRAVPDPDRPARLHRPVRRRARSRRSRAPAGQAAGSAGGPAPPAHEERDARRTIHRAAADFTQALRRRSSEADGLART